MSVSRSLGSKSSPASPSPSSLLVDGQARGDRHRAGRLGAGDEPGRGGDAVGGRDERRRRPRAPRRRRRRSARARAGRRAAASRRTGPRSEWTTASQRSAGSRRRSERRKSRRAPRSSCSTKAMRTGASSLALGARQRVGAGRDDRGSRPGRSGAAGPRSPRRSRCARRGARRRAARPCARPGWRRRARSGAWKVPTLSAREWRSAVLATLGAKGSCTWHRSSAARSKRSEIVRATSIGSAARRRPGQRRQRLAHGQHAHLAGGGLERAAAHGAGASRAPARARTTAPRR